MQKLEYQPPTPRKRGWTRQRWLIVGFFVLLVLSPVLMLAFFLLLVALGLEGPD